MSTETIVSDRHTSIIASAAMIAAIAIVVLPVTCVMHGRELDAREKAAPRVDIERVRLHCEMVIGTEPPVGSRLPVMECEAFMKPRVQ